VLRTALIPIAERSSGVDSSQFKTISQQEARAMANEITSQDLSSATRRTANLSAAEVGSALDAITAQCGQRPERTAVRCEDQELTYGALEARSNQLARRLQAMGVDTGGLVALYVDRSVDMLVGLLGIMKAGGAYVPVDPAFPCERVAYMLQDSAATVILSQGHLTAALPEHEAQVLCLDQDWSAIAQEDDGRIFGTTHADDLAYVIYTSGSTGKPKGVEVTHGALINVLRSMAREPGLDESDRLLAVTTLSFDIAGLELYLPLAVGGQVVIASRALAVDGAQLARTIEEQGITVMQATPATWRLLLQANWAGSPRLRVLCGGETLSRDLAEQLLPRCAQLWNLYGPTETTIWSTIYRVTSGTSAVPVGHPIDNTEILILDDDGQPVAPGTAGELFIGGDGLARGYLKQPELTAERFIAHPSGNTSAKRVYQTGDLVKRLPDGNLEHLGRADFQVKVRGFRIELGEIEMALERHAGARQAVVLAREDSPGDKRLVAYAAATGDAWPSSAELRETLGATRPDYMVPGLYHFVNDFPLTPNGKVDRKALPAPGAQRPELAQAFVAAQVGDETTMAAI
jgi:amino acid adenylation domain-containing protein